MSYYQAWDPERETYVSTRKSYSHQMPRYLWDKFHFSWRKFCGGEHIPEGRLIPTTVGIAACLGISERCLQNWRKQHPELDEVCSGLLTRYRAIMDLHHEQIALSGSNEDSTRAKALEARLKALASDTWAARQETVLTGGDKPIAMLSDGDLIKEIEALRQQAEAMTYPPSEDDASAE